MWDIVRPRRPFYRKPWFLSLLGLFAVLALVGAIFGYVQKEKWERKAEALDFTKLEEMESASIIYDRSGRVLGRIFIQNRDQVPLSEISQAVLTAVVAAEDTRYYEHHGWDGIGIARAF